MKEKILKILGLFCLLALLAFNVNVFAGVDPGDQAPDNLEENGSNGPDWQGFTFDDKQYCCKRRYHDDLCSGAYNGC